VWVFHGTQLARLDAKGRISVPAAFRDVLRQHAPDMAMVLMPNPRHPCLDAYPAPLHAALARRLEGLDPTGPDFEDLATMLYGDALHVAPDREGRILLPESHARYAQLGAGAEAAFVAVATRFQIWSAAAVEERKLNARARGGQLALPAVAAS
jgi:MraZ protein